MKKKLKMVFFASIFAIAFTNNVNAIYEGNETTVLEKVSEYSEPAYIVGSTRFNISTKITFDKVITATFNEMALQGPDFRREDMKTYLYNQDEDTWYEVKDSDSATDTGLVVITDEHKISELENNLKIYYVDNKEQILKLPYNGDVNPNTLSDGVTYDVGKGIFNVPATVKEFTYETSNGSHASVDVVDVAKPETNGRVEPTIDPLVTITPNFSEGVHYLGEALQFNVNVKGNSYADKKDYTVEYSMVKKGTETYGTMEYQSGDLTTIRLTDTDYAFTVNTNHDTSSTGYTNNLTYAGTYVVTFTVKDGDTVLASSSSEVTYEMKKPTLSTNLPTNMIVGKSYVFDISTVANDYAGLTILGNGALSNPKAIETLEYYEPNTSNCDTLGLEKDSQGGCWITLNGNASFGGSGFPLADATSTFRVTFHTAGEFTLNYNIATTSEPVEVLAEVKDSPLTVTFDATAPEASKYVAKVGTKYYTDLKTAIQVSNGREAVLTKDLTVDSLSLAWDFSDAKGQPTAVDLKLNLGGHILTVNNDIFFALLNGGSLTIDNGTINGFITNKNSAVIFAYGPGRWNENTTAETHLVIGKDLTINTDAHGILMAYKNMIIDVYGKINTSGQANAIAGNGTSGMGETTLNIYDGAVITANNGVGVYLPNIGTANITGGTITALLPVGIKAGTLNVTGGTLEALGNQANLSTYGNGINEPGDAIYVEVYAPPYAGYINLNVSSNATLTSAHQSPIRVFNATGEGIEANVEGYEVIYTEPVAKVNDTWYSNLDDAKAKYKAGDTFTYIVSTDEQLKVALADTTSKNIILRKDLHLTESVVIERDLTLDLGTHSIDKQVYVKNGAKVVIKNGSVTTNNATGILSEGENTNVEIINVNVTSKNSVGVATTTGATLTFTSGSVDAREASLLAYTNATLIVTDGTFTSHDNFVVGTNGTSGWGGTTITINGGTFNAGIISDNYIAAGMYIANGDTVTVNGGTFNVMNGVGILARSGNTTVSNNVIFNITQTEDGITNGWVGDNKYRIPTNNVIVKHTGTGYPGGQPTVTNNSSYDMLTIDGVTN